MKRIILFISLLLVGILSVAQDTLGLGLKDNLQVSLTEGIRLFIGFLDYTYMLVFMISAWLFNDSVDAINKSGRWQRYLQKVPKFFRTLFIGMLWILFFYWGFSYTTRLDIVSLVFSLFTSLAVYKVGVRQVFKLLSSRLLGLKLPEN